MIITVPLVPPSPNELRRKYRNPHAYRRLRQLWEHNLFYSACSVENRNELIEMVNSGSRMIVEITIHHLGRFDDDNLAGAQKPILDALVNIGFLKGDSLEHLCLKVARQVKSTEKKTVVVIMPYTRLTQETA